MNLKQLTQVVATQTKDATDSLAKDATSPLGSYAEPGGTKHRVLMGSTSLKEAMDKLSLSEFCRSHSEMRIFMERLMNINLNEKARLTQISGMDAHFNGDPDSLTPDVLIPSYAQGRNYIDFVENVKKNEKFGAISTQRNVNNYDNQHMISPSHFDSGNLYPDDLGIGTGDFSDLKKWNIGDNTESILFKTKRLFQQNKINTLISRFGTNADGLSNDILYNGSNRSRFGESRGRNLLKRDAEYAGQSTSMGQELDSAWRNFKNRLTLNGFRGGIGSDNDYNINGYNNPYCRVWTHHHQYDKYSKTIRPFNTDEEKPMSLKELHNWKTFDNGNEWGWKNGTGNGNDKWDKSVLETNDKGDGLLKITPKYVGGGKENVHTKDCMFSIENLAWRGYSPYEFESALSWEQRGPLGGRIMWFPPYGISFNESANVNWSANSFIGRGEDVYTYVNTQRSGSLTFLMVVDHPSILDYATWNENNNKLEDSDLLRFFAGCDTLDPNDEHSIMSAVQPTPMTDEYEESTITEETIRVKKTPPEADPEDPPTRPTGEIKVHFSVYFPNNYTGYFDDPEFALNYLYRGSGAQMKNGGKDNLETFSGGGYEINQGISNGTDDDNNFICQTNAKTGKIRTDRNAKKWHYRIDYKYGSTDPHNRAHEKLSDNNYVDSASNGFNKNRADEISTDTDYYVSFTEFIDVLLRKTKGIGSGIDDHEALPKESGDKITDFLYEVFGVKVPTVVSGATDEKDETNNKKSYKLTKVEVSGYSSNQGLKDSNVRLARSRGETIFKWIKLIKNDKNFENFGETLVFHPSNGGRGNDNVNNPTAKKNRRSDVTLYFQVDDIKKASDMTEQPRQTTGEKPIEKEPEVEYETITTRKVIAQKRSEQDRNRVRYDQEYYFFKALKQKDPLVFNKLMDKIQYFDPAFHSMTPEGFNARLTFLHQCTRQGNTVTMSDNYGKTANNLAFGRPPFCVLRIGDFYNQLIIIESINIDYSVSNGIMWDMNSEGAGMQPLLAQIQINFKFIGGGDLSGPIRRLQNAMSFNYYANTSLYDNRADRVRYISEGNDSVMGAAGQHNVDIDNSYAHIVGHTNFSHLGIKKQDD